MNRRQKIIVSVVGIFIVLLALVGLTYAYFLTQIKGNTNNKSISVTTANLRLVYGGDDGSIIGDGEIIEPGTTFKSKTFTVTNEGNAKIDNYAVIIENFGVYYNEDSTIINETGEEVKVYANDVTNLSRTEDFEIVITCKNQDEEECTGYNGTLPTESAIMLTNSIEVDEVQTYTATLTYAEANTNQSADMNKRIEGKFNIIGLSDTVDLTGTVTSYQKGDYVQTNSTKRVSVINPDGTYKVLGLETGTHKIKVCAADPEHPEVKDCSDEEAKMVQEINIVQGDTANGNDTTKTITITEESREATIDVDVGNTITINNEIKDYNPFEDVNSLAYNIFANAYNGENGTTFVNKPLTIPAMQKNDYLYSDGKVSSVETIYNSTTGSTQNYYTYGDTYKYSSTYSILNKDGSSLETVEGFSTLKGKYIVSTSGSASTEPESATGKSTIYYVADVDDTKIYYISLNGGKASNEYNYTYGDSYEFNEKTGKYTIKNKDGSALKTVKYNSNFEILKDKYIVSTSGSKWGSTESGENLSKIYKVSTNSSSEILKYYTITKKNEITYLENILTTTPDDYGTSYYYRGAVKKNYVTFAGMCWKIVRIVGDGSIKLILEDKDQVCSSNIDGNWKIGSANFGFDSSSKSTSGSTLYKMNYLNPVTKANKSMIKAFYDFQTNKLSKYLTKLKSGDWCLGDKAYTRTETSDAYSHTLLEDTSNSYLEKNTFYYDSNVRLTGRDIKGYQPSLKCNGTVLSEFNDVTYESVKIITQAPMYVNTIINDEIVYAGGLVNRSNAHYYLINNYQKDGSVDFYTLSPSKFEEGYDLASLATSDGGIYASNIHVDRGLRPAINLAKGVIIEEGGNGTISNPYVIK